MQVSRAYLLFARLVYGGMVSGASCDIVYFWGPLGTSNDVYGIYGFTTQLLLGLAGNRLRQVSVYDNPSHRRKRMYHLAI